MSEKLNPSDTPSWVMNWTPHTMKALAWLANECSLAKERLKDNYDKEVTKLLKLLQEQVVLWNKSHGFFEQIQLEQTHGKVKS